MKITIIHLILHLLVVSQLCAQGEQEYVSRAIISDSTFIHVIETFTADLNQTDNYFKKGQGYFEIRAVEGNNPDVLMAYYISPSLFNFDSRQNDLPPYYDIVGQKPILIYITTPDPLIFQISVKKETKLKALIEPYLPQQIVLENSSEKDPPFKYRDEVIYLHFSKVIEYHKDGSVSIRDATYKG
ncbi:hypothetical protein [Reichenbachiella sp. MSK19-1]|uniref:hypothetical protein n=1 Tax=Reichenbachiella sp. MSK19-1 TaxID=1897631 RepID=UPI000E6C5853|nr:hypothetical protein [Reichenbachiella sp. MSK19-1]RJE74404.1 hypothetical protein BGP76_14685 [Reichenbachiella sp. MSK19-1]